MTIRLVSFLEKTNYFRFIQATLCLYIITGLINKKIRPDYDLEDLLGIRFNISAYLAIIFSTFLSFLAYSGNIITLALSPDIVSTSEPTLLLTSFSHAVLYQNCLLAAFILLGLNMFNSIILSALLASFHCIPINIRGFFTIFKLRQVFSLSFFIMLQKVDTKVIKRLKKSNDQHMRMMCGFLRHCYQGYVFLITGSSLGCWCVAALCYLLEVPNYHITKIWKRGIFVVHMAAVVGFVYFIPILLNPYLFTGVFYRIYVENNVI